MTDKQMIIDGVDVAECRCFISEWDFNNCGHICKGTECEYKRLWYKKQLKRKEKECERLKHDNDYEVGALEKTIDSLKAENGKLEQVLTEIKPILELYANSKIGEEQIDGTYKIIVEDLRVLGGTYIIFYDPKPAKQALQKISEYEVENER